MCPITRWDNPAALPFGLSLSASLARCNLRCLWQFTWIGHFLQPCRSDRIDARSRGDRLAAVASSRRWREVVSAASDPTVAGRAGADRLLRTEPQVRLTISLFISNYHRNHFHLARVIFTQNETSVFRRSPAAETGTVNVILTTASLPDFRAKIVQSLHKMTFPTYCPPCQTSQHLDSFRCRDMLDATEKP